MVAPRAGSYLRVCCADGAGLGTELLGRRPAVRRSVRRKRRTHDQLRGDQARAGFRRSKLILGLIWPIERAVLELAVEQPSVREPAVLDPAGLLELLAGGARADDRHRRRRDSRRRDYS